MVAIKALVWAFAIISTEALALPKLQARELAEIDFYDNCDGLIQTPYQASHPGTSNDVGVCAMRDSTAWLLSGQQVLLVKVWNPTFLD
jgi:hypothetical protein